VVGVLLVARVVGEHERAPEPPRQPRRRRPQQERVVRVEDVDGERAHPRRDGARKRNRQRELGIRGGRDRGVAQHAGRVGEGPGEARREHPGLVPAVLEAAPQRLDGDGHAAAEGRVVVREERDAHAGGQALLYFSKSSGLMFCSHSRSCSGSSVLTGSPSLAPSILPGSGNTSSSTKIRSATRKASAMASEGRESTVYSAVLSWRWWTAEKVF